MEKPQFKIILLLFLMLVVLAGAFVVAQGKKQAPDSASAAPLNKPAPISSSKPVPTPSTFTVGSPDGKSELKLTKEVKDQNTNTWSLFVDGVRIFRNTYPKGTKVEVPQNTFSPDNKYVFLKIDSGSVVSYPVFSVKNGIESEGSPTLEFSSLFYEKFPGYKITEATGWGGLNLIVFNTVEAESGKRGPSFWFEVPTHSFIRLSTQFN